MQRKAGIIYVTIQSYRSMKFFMLRGGLIGYCCLHNRYVLIPCRIVCACPVQVGHTYGQWCDDLHWSKPMSCTGGGSVYPKFWSVAVLTVVIRLVLLKGKSSIVLSLVWGILSWQESWLRLGLLVMSTLR